jgi:hypothetical protein
MHRDFIAARVFAGKFRNHGHDWRLEIEESALVENHRDSSSSDRFRNGGQIENAGWRPRVRGDIVREMSECFEENKLTVEGNCDGAAGKRAALDGVG